MTFAQKLAHLRSRLYVKTRPGLMSVKTYALGSGELVAITAVDMEHRIVKVFWKKEGEWRAFLP